MPTQTRRVFFTLLGAAIIGSRVPKLCSVPISGPLTLDRLNVATLEALRPDLPHLIFGTSPLMAYLEARFNLDYNAPRMNKIFSGLGPQERAEEIDPWNDDEEDSA